MRTFWAVLLLLVELCGAGEPLKVYILAGQSNMVGDGSATTFSYIQDDPKTRPLYEKMIDKKGKPRTCERVWISYLNGKMADKGKVVTGRLTAGYGKRIYAVPRFAPFVGPEFAFGVTMEAAHKGPVLLIKVAWGGQSLHKDFCPPSATKGGSKKGGRRYQQLIEHVRGVLADVKGAYPDYDEKAGYELAGLAWFQGWNDYVDMKVYPRSLGKKQYEKYSKLMETFIEDVRKDLEAPKLPVVIGVMGIHGNFKEGTYRKIAGLEERTRLFREAMAYPAGLPKFKGTVSAVDTSDFWDEELAAIDMKKAKVKTMRGHLERKRKGYANEDGKMSAAEQKAFLENYQAEVLSEKELEQWSRGASVGGFVHYFGSAKFYSQAGEAFAQALLEMNED